MSGYQRRRVSSEGPAARAPLASAASPGLASRPSAGVGSATPMLEAAGLASLTRQGALQVVLNGAQPAPSGTAEVQVFDAAGGSTHGATRVSGSGRRLTVAGSADGLTMGGSASLSTGSLAASATLDGHHPDQVHGQASAQLSRADLEATLRAHFGPEGAESIEAEGHGEVGGTRVSAEAQVHMSQEELTSVAARFGLSDVAEARSIVLRFQRSWSGGVASDQFAAEVRTALGGAALRLGGQVSVGGEEVHGGAEGSVAADVGGVGVEAFARFATSEAGLAGGGGVRLRATEHVEVSMEVEGSEGGEVSGLVGMQIRVP